MRNPFLINRTYIISYIAAWILVAGIHAAVLWLTSGQELWVAISDSLVFNILFAGIALGLWYSIRYYDFNKAGISDRLLNHLLIAIIVLGVWMGLGYLVLNAIWANQPDYHGFLINSLPWRGISGLFFYFLIILIYYLYINSEDRKARISKESTLRLQVKEAEIERLKSQINPHFLFNSLNSVSSLIISQPEQAREMLVRLSGFLRYSLENKNNNVTTLEAELENIRYYLEIEKVRFGKRLQFDFIVPEECLKMTIPHMILQPLVENAIKHGVYESTEPVKIELKAMTNKPEILMVEISNDFDPEAPPRKGKGIGLINTQNRLKLAFNCDHCLTVERTDNRFTIKLTIPQFVKDEHETESPDH
ncbi:MAG: histidine kinase [Bacteroidales bacterium]|jgi:sensor histidine kinase YesM